MSETKELDDCCALCCGYIQSPDKKESCYICCCASDNKKDLDNSFCYAFCFMCYNSNKTEDYEKQITYGFLCGVFKLIFHYHYDENISRFVKDKQEKVLCNCISIFNGDIQLHNNKYTTCLLTCCHYNLCYNEPYMKKLEECTSETTPLTN